MLVTVTNGQVPGFDKYCRTQYRKRIKGVSSARFVYFVPAADAPVFQAAIPYDHYVVVQYTKPEEVAK